MEGGERKRQFRKRDDKVQLMSKEIDMIDRLLRAYIVRWGTVEAAVALNIMNKFN